MPQTDSDFFEILKSKIAEQVRVEFPENGSIAKDWKGDEITNFQEDLSSKVSGRISEKWFYTHIKSQSENVPRVDILNLLSTYVGYKNWIDFKANASTSTKKASTKKGPILLAVIILAFVGVVAGSLYSSREFKFILVDRFTNQPINADWVQVYELKTTESSNRLEVNEKGEYIVTDPATEVTLVINSGYFKTDTIRRMIRKRKTYESFPLQSDDYALMLRIFSNSEIKDWTNRRQQLDSMFVDNAYIYQIYPGKNIGMELFNKPEFISKLTTPINSLKNIEILDVVYRGNKIKELRFKQKEDE